MPELVPTLPLYLGNRNSQVRRKKWSDDYVTDLEAQVAAWKAYAQDLETSQTVSSLSEHKEASDEAGIPSIEATYHLSRDVYDGEDIVGKQSMRAIDEMGAMMWKMNIGQSGEPSFTGPSGNFHLSQASAPITDRRCLLPLRETGHQTTFTELSQDLGMKQLLAELFILYFNPVHLFLQPGTMLSVEDYPHADPGLRLLHTAIFAAALRYSIIDGSEELSDVLMEHAEATALKCCKTCPSVKVVQALSILCWRELNEGHDSMAWIYTSMAGGLTISLGLHAMGLRNLAGPTIAADPNEHNIRIRTFWTFLFVERVLVTLFGRHCTIPWQRVDTPSLGSILAADASLDEVAFDHHCQLGFIHDKYMEQMLEIYPMCALERVQP
ncbi:hypothetical protein BP5796_11951 [Coleophoma crateriformis]|uniref:Xylanolytic transcriptional activator regulatory domain-containing protein n=1 Tax=Coleophoma crateriformis TaxID=565419 RepID=A0A3D8QBE4_9HELO|nr:hypothetical protein BP5796_11951 [Coleophoma crateriformis]